MAGFGSLLATTVSWSSRYKLQVNSIRHQSEAALGARNTLETSPGWRRRRGVGGGPEWIMVPKVIKHRGQAGIHGGQGDGGTNPSSFPPLWSCSVLLSVKWVLVCALDTGAIHLAFHCSPGLSALRTGRASQGPKAGMRVGVGVDPCPMRGACRQQSPTWASPAQRPCSAASSRPPAPRRTVDVGPPSGEREALQGSRPWPSAAGPP